MTKKIAFEMGGTLTVVAQAPRKVDVIIEVPSKPDMLLAFAAKHPSARIVGYSEGDVAA